MRTSRVMQEETKFLQTAIYALRKAYMDQQKLNSQTNPDTFVLRQLEEISATQRKIQNTLMILNTERVKSRQRPIPDPHDAKHPHEKENQKSLNFQMQ